MTTKKASVTTTTAAPDATTSIDYSYDGNTDSGSGSGSGSGTGSGEYPTEIGDYGNEGPTDEWASDNEIHPDYEVYLMYVILGLGLFCALVIILWSICTPWLAKGKRVIRWYATNLMLCGIVHIFIFAYNSGVLAPNFQKFVGGWFNVTKSYEFGLHPVLTRYSKDMRSWFACVYAFTTACAAIDSVWRYLSRRNGFPHLLWYNIVLFADFVPLVYIVLTKEIYTSFAPAPAPLPSYHAIMMIFLGFGGLAFVILTIVMVVIENLARKRIPRAFSLSDLVCMTVYGLITALFLYTGVVGVITSILQSFGDKGNAIAMNLGSQMPSVVSLQLSMDEWSLAAMVFVQAFLIIIFGPTYPLQPFVVKGFVTLFAACGLPAARKSKTNMTTIVPIKQAFVEKRAMTPSQDSSIFHAKSH